MEVKNKYAYVITQDICNKFIEVFFLWDVWFHGQIVCCKIWLPCLLLIKFVTSEQPEYVWFIFFKEIFVLNFLTILWNTFIYFSSHPLKSVSHLLGLQGTQNIVPQLIALMNLISSWQCTMYGFGGFQLLDLIITELKNHMTCYKSMPLIGWNYSIQTGEQIL